MSLIKALYSFNKALSSTVWNFSNASFKIDDIEYNLNKNGENGSCLHSGYDSYTRKLWNAKTFSDSTGCGIVFSRTSYDGEQGFPGNLEIQVIYSNSRGAVIKTILLNAPMQTEVVLVFDEIPFSFLIEKETTVISTRTFTLCAISRTTIPSLISLILP